MWSSCWQRLFVVNNLVHHDHVVKSPLFMALGHYNVCLIVMVSTFKFWHTGCIFMHLVSYGNKFVSRKLMKKNIANLVLVVSCVLVQVFHL